MVKKQEVKQSLLEKLDAMIITVLNDVELDFPNLEVKDKIDILKAVTSLKKLQTSIESTQKGDFFTATDASENFDEDDF